MPLLVVLALVPRIPASAAGVLTVSTASDVANGDVTSPDALRASPGSDGISLREAIQAANAATGTDPITIQFSPALAGQSIVLTAQLNDVTRDDVAVEGFDGAGGTPAVTIDARNTFPFLLEVTASNFRFSGLRVLDVGQMWGLAITAGLPGRPLAVHGVDIEDNVFTNDMPTGHAIGIGTWSTSTGAVVDDVTIAGNTFMHIRGPDFANGHDAILAAVRSTRGTISNVTVRDNSFSDIDYPVEFVCSDGTEGLITATRIVGNSFDNNQQAVNINQIGNPAAPPTSGNTIDGTLISGNIFTNNHNLDVVVLGGLANATGNSITNTTIVDNVMLGDTGWGGLNITGGRDGASNNVVHGVRVANNTFVGNHGQGGAIGRGVTVRQNSGGTGNTATGVSVANSIFSDNDEDISDQGLSQVSYSLFPPGSQFPGSNGNIAGDPLFVDRPGRNLDLQPGSPGIDAGTSDNVPATDIEDRLRYDDPTTPDTGAGSVPYVDMGAYEYGGIPRPLLTVTSAATDGARGTVTSAPAAITCPGTCRSGFDPGTTVTLTATAGPASRFTGWSGACTGTGTCQLAMDQPRAVTASFVQTYALTVSPAGSGGGTVTSSDGSITCGTACTHTYDSGTTVTFDAAAADGSRFTGWSGACTGTGTCQLTMDRVRAVTASFVQTYALTVSLAGSGAGTVTSSDGSIACGTACTNIYDSGTVVTLDAAAASGATFAGWSGACTGTGSCQVVLTADLAVTGWFTLNLPANVVAPQITGTPRLGRVLTCSTGTWTPSPTGVARQWYRNGTAITGATGVSRTVAAADLQRRLTCAVTAYNSAGASAPATSRAVTVVAATVLTARETSSTWHVRSCGGSSAHACRDRKDLRIYLRGAATPVPIPSAARTVTIRFYLRAAGAWRLKATKTVATSRTTGGWRLAAAGVTYRKGTWRVRASVTGRSTLTAANSAYRYYTVA